MNEHNIILTGFMGTGKTTVGRLLAERLNRQFVDSDELIVARNGRSIADIFSTEGESFFRDLESQITQELAAKRGMVIATGGRLMLDPHNAELLSATGAVFCLTADPEQILARVASDDTRRPLLAGPNPAWHIRQLLHERAKDYGRFPQIMTSGKSAAAVAAEIIALLDANILTVTHPNGC
ncbi:MAG: shikimate kinase, partial [Anaerolineales bacterium]|nr:shikimate kinase [Anaerolineales bacterium]